MGKLRVNFVLAYPQATVESKRYRTGVILYFISWIKITKEHLWTEASRTCLEQAPALWISTVEVQTIKI